MNIDKASERERAERLVVFGDSVLRVYRVPLWYKEIKIEVISAAWFRQCRTPGPEH